MPRNSGDIKKYYACKNIQSCGFHSLMHMIYINDCLPTLNQKPMDWTEIIFKRHLKSPLQTHFDPFKENSCVPNQHVHSKIELMNQR